MTSLAQTPFPLHFALSLLLPIACGALLLMAAMCDLASRTIPNRFPALLSILGLFLQQHDATLAAALVAAGAVFALCSLAWVAGLMGGGDVKLLSALAFCVPPAAVLSLITATGLAGGILGLFYLVLRRTLSSARPVGRVPLSRGRHQLRLVARLLRAERWRIGRGSPLPYGLAIAAGGLFTLF